MRKVNWNPLNQIVKPEPSPPVSPSQPLTHNTFEQPQKVRNGNGHHSEMVRKLNEGERAQLKNKFLSKNGQIANDDCVIFKGQMISDCIAIFQITGYISVLHRYVAMGRLKLRDLNAYKEWMHAKYKGLWNQYTSERFSKVRAANMRSLYKGQEPTATIPIEEVPIETTAGPLSTTPTFKVFGARRSYCLAT